MQETKLEICATVDFRAIVDSCIPVVYVLVISALLVVCSHIMATQSILDREFKSPFYTIKPRETQFQEI